MSGTDGGAVTASPVSGDSSNTQPSSHITTSAGASVVTVGPTQMSANAYNKNSDWIDDKTCLYWKDSFLLVNGN